MKLLRVKNVQVEINGVLCEAEFSAQGMLLIGVKFEDVLASQQGDNQTQAKPAEVLVPIVSAYSVQSESVKPTVVGAPPKRGRPVRTKPTIVLEEMPAQELVTVAETVPSTVSPMQVLEAITDGMAAALTVPAIAPSEATSTPYPPEVINAKSMTNLGSYLVNTIGCDCEAWIIAEFEKMLPYVPIVKSHKDTLPKLARNICAAFGIPVG